MKVDSSKTKRTKRTMMRTSFQAYVVPPHCEASKRQTIPKINTTLPGRFIHLLVPGCICFARTRNLEEEG